MCHSALSWVRWGIQLLMACAGLPSRVTSARPPSAAYRPVIVTAVPVNVNVASALSRADQVMYAAKGRSLRATLR